MNDDEMTCSINWKRNTPVTLNDFDIDFIKYSMENLRLRRYNMFETFLKNLKGTHSKEDLKSCIDDYNQKVKPIDEKLKQLNNYLNEYDTQKELMEENKNEKGK